MEMTIKKIDLGYTLAVGGDAPKLYGSEGALKRAATAAILRIIDEVILKPDAGIG
jgi:hypothetical protein